MNKITQKYQGKTICPNHAKVLDAVNVILEYSKAHPEKNDQLTDKDIYDGLVEAYPCPFNPKNVAVRSIKSADIVGFWTLAPSSQQLSPKFSRESFSLPSANILVFIPMAI